MKPNGLSDLAMHLRTFAQEREWDQFHSPKNLVMALSAECGELLEHFQWLTEAESRELSAERKAQVSLEMADILLYLVRLADKLDIDLLAAAKKKIEINKGKYPISSAKGTAKKYTEL